MADDGSISTKLLAAVGAMVVVFPLVFGLFIVVVAWRTWWLYPAWGWYVVPLGVPAIGFWHFAALLTLASAVVSHMSTKKDDRREDWAKFTVNFLMPCLTWVLLWWMR